MWEPFGICLLNSSENPADQFAWKWPKLAVLFSRQIPNSHQILFSYNQHDFVLSMGCQKWLHLCPPILIVCFWQSRWCERFTAVAKVENSAQCCVKLKEKKACVFVKFFASHGGGQSYISQVLLKTFEKKGLTKLAIWVDRI